MKILIFTDVHWSTTTSILKDRGDKYSKRLEILIDSVNWVNELAISNNCESMICAGDFFDKPYINDEELTALMDVKWNNLPKYFLCGNHESSVGNLSFNVVNALTNGNNKIIDEVYSQQLGSTELLFIPYINERDRKELSEYIDKTKSSSDRIIISHNDIKGINYGGFESKIGFNIDDIENSCSLYLNGHLHNSSFITNRILNLGSLTAHNFTNNSFNYKYGCWILNTETRELQFYENPYSLQFYKLVIDDISKLKELDKLKRYSVVSVSCVEDILNDVRDYLDKSNNIIKYQLSSISRSNKKENTEEIKVENHLDKFKSFCTNNIKDDVDILMYELSEICK